MFSVSPRFISIPQSFIFSTVFPNPLLRVIRLSEISRLTLLIVVAVALSFIVNESVIAIFLTVSVSLENDIFSSTDKTPSVPVKTILPEVKPSAVTVAARKS